MSYVALNAVFLGVVAVVVAVAAVRRVMPWRASGIALAVLLVMTAVFDNIMIAIGLVAYEPSRILGLRIGVAPIEDFGYAIAAVLLLPAVWGLLPSRASADRAAVRSVPIDSAASRSASADHSGTRASERPGGAR